MEKFFVRTGALATGFALASVVGGSAHAIVTQSDDYDYWHQRLARDYPTVVQMWGFDTSLTKTGSFDNGDLTYGITLNNFATSVSSGVLVDSEWVMTAAHSVIDQGWFQFDIGGEMYTAEQWFVPSGTQDGGDTTEPETVFGEDIAFVRLDRAVTNVTPTQLHRGHMNLKDKEFEVVGYGTYETVDGSGFGFSGVKRAARNRYDVDQPGSIVSGSLFLMHDMDIEGLLPPVEPGEQHDPEKDFPIALEGSTRTGDSGGGEFVNGLLTGITSFGFNVNDNASGIRIGDFGASTEVSRFAQTFDDLLNRVGIFSDTPTNFGLEFGTAGFSIADVRDDDDLPAWFFSGMSGNLADGDGNVDDAWVSIDPTTGELEVIGPRSFLSSTEAANERNAITQHLATSKLRYKDMSFHDELTLATMEALLTLEQIFGPGKSFSFDGNGLGPILGGASDEYDPAEDGSGPGTGAPILIGDIWGENGGPDGYVDSYDLARLLGNWNSNAELTDWMLGYIGPEQDGIIDHDDLALLLGNWTGSPDVQLAALSLLNQTIPEPASLALLLVGGSVVLARRRHA